MLSESFRNSALAEDGSCRMLTEIPVKDWINCPAVPTTLSALLGTIVPGQLRKVETVFEVSDLQVLGISSVKSETDEWLIASCKRCKRAMPCQKHPGEAEERRMAVRLTVADGNSQSAVMLYHDLLLRTAATMSVDLPESLVDGKQLRESLRDMFRNAQWLCRFTFKENDYQQSMELECRDIRPCLKLQPSFLLLDSQNADLSLPHCRLNDGCPVTALQNAKADFHLGVISVGKVDASYVRALVRFNAVQLPDDESVQHDQSAMSAMRVKKSFDCVLSDQKNVTQVKLRAAGPASVVNWMLQGRAGEVHQVVLSQTDTLGEWNVLWQVPVAKEVVASGTQYFSRLAASEMEMDKGDVDFEPKWTPLKRIHFLRDAMPETARQSQAWNGTLPECTEPDAQAAESM